MQYRNPLILLAMMVGAVVSRWHGGGFVKAAKALKNAVWALPFGVVAYFATGQIVLAVIAFALCLAGKASGHGGFFDLGTWFKPRKDEALEFIIKPLKARMPEYWYDVLGMALLGFAAVSGAVVTIVWYDPLAALIIAIGGLLKAPAYMIGWKFFNPVKRPEPTEVGEYLTGAAAFGACALAYLMV